MDRECMNKSARRLVSEDVSYMIGKLKQSPLELALDISPLLFPYHKDIFVFKNVPSFHSRPLEEDIHVIFSFQELGGSFGSVELV